MITQHSWMFLSSFEKLREKMMLTETVNMAHLGARAFEEIGGEVVQTTAFVRCINHVTGYKGTYCRLIEPTSQQGKEEMFLAGQNRYTANQDDFAKIPGSPVAYWVSKKFYFAFEHGNLLENIAHPKKGLATTDNGRFLRLWQEISEDTFGIGFKTAKAAWDSEKKWFPINKGGEYRRWYGNKEYVVNWQCDGKEMKEAIVKRYNGGSYTKEIRSESRYFQNSITWSALTAGTSSFRWSDYGALFDSAGSSMFPEKDWKYLIALLNTKVVNQILCVINPTLNYGAGSIANIPVVFDELYSQNIEQIAEENVELSKTEWNSFEASWDFKKHPLLCNVATISEAFTRWQKECDDRFNRLKSNEEELNRIFIDIYGLHDELTPEVEDKDVTVRKADLQRDIKSLLSYAVGCMFGRYSLDVEGLAYAGGEWDSSKYQSYIPDADNVIPITDEEYLDDDIVSRLCAWLKAVYGADTLEENLDYIAKALGNKGSTSREIIRNYFLNDFFKDHCQTYSVTGSGKRPIYWLFDSGKQNGFKALVYLHRYTPDTIGNLRIDYLHKMQRVYESEINRMQDMMDHSDNAREVAAASKRKDKLAKQLKECREYDEKISHLALSRIELDLDDGVKVNYRKLQTAQDGKFYEVLADSKNIMVKEKK